MPTNTTLTPDRTPEKESLPIVTSDDIVVANTMLDPRDAGLRHVSEVWYAFERGHRRYALVGEGASYLLCATDLGVATEIVKRLEATGHKTTSRSLSFDELVDVAFGQPNVSALFVCTKLGEFFVGYVRQLLPNLGK